MSEENAEAAEAMQTDTAEKENVSENASALRKARKNKLGLLTRRMNIIKDLMNDKSNVKEVNENCVTFGELLKALEAIHEEYQNTLSEEDRELDDNTWYKPKRESHRLFIEDVDDWLQECENKDEENEIGPEDSVSATHSKNATDAGSKVSATSSAVAHAAAEKAVLEVKLEALKQKHAIEAEEAELSKRQENLKKQKEMLDLRCELDAANAKLDVLSKSKSHVSVRVNE